MKRMFLVSAIKRFGMVSGQILECGGSTPLWIFRGGPHPKRRRAAALQKMPGNSVSSILLTFRLHGDDDLGLGPELRQQVLADPITKDIFGHLLHLLKLRLFTRTTIGNQNQVITELGRDHVTHLVRLESEGGPGE